MKEHSHLSIPSTNAQQDDPTPEHDSIELIESEMEGLRQRMKRLELRLGKLTGNSAPTPLPNASAETQSYSSSKQSGVILTPATPNQSTNKTARRQRPKKQIRSNAKQTTRPHRKKRSSKVKRNFLFGYGLLIGVGVVSVFVLMIINIFSDNMYIPMSTSREEIVIDETPDLEELRMSIQEADE